MSYQIGLILILVIAAIIIGKKYNKPKQEDTSEEKEILQIEDKSSEQSDVGQSVKEEPKVQKKLTASDIAFEAVLALDTNGISKEEFLVALKEQLELIEENIQLDEVA